MQGGKIGAGAQPAELLVFGVIGVDPLLHLAFGFCQFLGTVGGGQHEFTQPEVEDLGLHLGDQPAGIQVFSNSLTRPSIFCISW